MHAIRRLVPFGLIALSSAFAQNPVPEPAPLPPGVPTAEAPVTPPSPDVPTPAPAVPAPTPGGPGGGTGRPPLPNRGGAAAPAEAANQNNVPLAERKETKPLINPKINGNDLAGLYHQYTGRRVVVSAAAAAAEFSFVQEASPSDPLTYKQISELLKMSALIEGFVFVPSGDNVDKLLFANGNNPKGYVPVFDENDVLPEADEVIAYVMTFQHLKPETAVQIFNSITGQVGSYGSVVAVPNASAVVITENTSLIRKLIQLKEEIDVPGGNVVRRMFKVQYADVTELAQTLNELFSAQQQTQRTAGIQRDNNIAPIQGAPPGAGGGNRSAGSAGEETPVQIIPDPRTNRILAFGKPSDIAFVETLIKDFDTKTDEKNFLRRKLRYLSASDFLPIASDALTRNFTGTGGGGASGGQGASGANFGQQGGGGNRGGSNTGGSSNRNSGGSRTSATGGSSSSAFGGSGSGSSLGGGGSGGSGTASSLSDPNVSTAPTSVLVGRTLLVADNITNSIIVQGPPANLEVIEKLLDEVDVRADQVMISTVFGQLSLTDNVDYGVNFLRTFRGSVAGSSINGGAPIVDPSKILAPVLNGTGVTNGFPGGGGLNLYGQIGKNLNVYINALQATGKFSVLSRPSIYTANNKKGEISSGQQIAVPTGTNNSGVNGNFQTQIEYKDVVLKLEVIPLINSADEVTLQIALTSDEVGDVQSIEGVGDVPTILTRAMTTTVTVPNNQTVVLGGLIITRDRDNKSGVPVLSKIPVLGKLFSSTNKDKEKSELLIFMQPSIVRNSANLDAVQIDMDRRYKVAPELHSFADGPGAVPPPDGIVPVTDKTGRTVTNTTTVVEEPVEKPKAKRPMGRR